MAAKKIFTEYGSTPEFHKIKKINDNFRSLFWSALTFAHYEISPLDLKKEVLKYLKLVNHTLYLQAKIVHENKFVSIGKYIYIFNNGGDIIDDLDTKFIFTIENIINENKKNTVAEVNEESNVENTVITIQDRLKEKATIVAGEIEGWVDEFLVKKNIKTIEEFNNLFKSYDLKSPHIGYIESKFKNRINELEIVINGDDKFYIEAYSNLTKTEIKKFISFFNNLYSACNMIKEISKVERAPKKKKPIVLEKVVSKLKYKKEEVSLGIVSINPTQIPGSKEMWVYNTKTRKLSQYKAQDEAGLNVKGSAILNYSTESAEKTLRQPATTLAEFKKSSKVKLRTFLKELSTIDIPVSGRLNEHHVILRVDK